MTDTTQTETTTGGQTPPTQLATVPAALETAVEKPKIPTRRLGATGLVVSELSLGTWGVSGEGYGPLPEGEADAIVTRALELGITLFETAAAYEKGGTESRLGRLLSGHDVFVATRIGVDRDAEPPRKCFEPSFLEKQIARSKERLQKKQLDILLLHNPRAQTLANPELVSFLKEQRANGSVRSWGVAAGDSEVAQNALQNGAEVLELAYNVLFDGDLAVIGSDVDGNQVGVLARSVLGYGVLSGLVRADRVFPQGDHRRERFSGDDLKNRIAHAEAIRVLVGGKVLNWRAAAVRFVLENNLVSSAVLGPRSTVQLEQLVREAGRGAPYLDPNRLAKLPRELAARGVFT